MHRQHLMLSVYLLLFIIRGLNHFPYKTIAVNAVNSSGVQMLILDDSRCTLGIASSTGYAVQAENKNYCCITQSPFSVLTVLLNKGNLYRKKREFQQQQIIMLPIFQITFTIHLTPLVVLDQTELIVLMVVLGGMLILFGK